VATVAVEAAAVAEEAAAVAAEEAAAVVAAGKRSAIERSPRATGRYGSWRRGDAFTCRH
jgi:hypothetical protein